MITVTVKPSDFLKIDTSPKYIYFTLISSTSKTGIWEVRNKDSDYLLGEVKWYPKWRQYCFCPTDQSVVFSKGCLQDIVSFISERMRERKKSYHEN